MSYYPINPYDTGITVLYPPGRKYYDSPNRSNEEAYLSLMEIEKEFEKKKETSRGYWPVEPNKGNPMKVRYPLDKKDIINELSNPGKTSWAPEEVEYALQTFDMQREYITKEDIDNYLYELRQGFDVLEDKLEKFDKGISIGSLRNFASDMRAYLGEFTHLEGEEFVRIANKISGKILKPKEVVYYQEDMERIKAEGYEEGYKKCLSDIETKNKLSFSTLRNILED